VHELYRNNQLAHGQLLQQFTTFLEKQTFPVILARYLKERISDEHRFA
jgi:hypothetical protein